MRSQSPSVLGFDDDDNTDDERFDRGIAGVKDLLGSFRVRHCHTFLSNIPLFACVWEVWIIVECVRDGFLGFKKQKILSSAE